MHHTQYIKDLIDSGRLSIDADKASLSKNAIAYHDSCYLGRYNEEYEAPRALLEHVPGLSVLEPARSKIADFAVVPAEEECSWKKWLVTA